MNDHGYYLVYRLEYGVRYYVTPYSDESTDRDNARLFTCGAAQAYVYNIRGPMAIAYSFCSYGDAK